MISAPRVTVIIATYNYSEVLPYSIGSVQRQTFSDWELLIVGDGCTDDSSDVVARTASGDERIRWINLPENFGQAAAPNNEGLRQARGEIIAYLGHDDLWLPHHLAHLVAAIDAGADLAYGLVESVPPGAEPTVIPTNPRQYLPGQWIPPTGVAHRRALTEKTGGWRDHRTIPIDPESDLWQRIHAGGGTIVFVPRLTAIKFGADARKNVYRERPCHEQAAWTKRLITEPDFEAVELGRMVGLLHTAPETAPIPTLFQILIRQALWRTKVRLLRGNLTMVEHRRRYKGLPTHTSARFPEA